MQFSGMIKSSLHKEKKLNLKILKHCCSQIQALFFYFLHAHFDFHYQGTKAIMHHELRKLTTKFIVKATLRQVYKSYYKYFEY